MRVQLLLLLAPALLAAAPLILTDPALQDLMDVESLPLNTRLLAETSRHVMDPYDPKSSNSIYHYSTYDLPIDDQLHDYDEDLRLEDKRSGLRAAMVARGNKGIRLRPGWQVGGDPITVRVEPENEGGLISRRSQPAASPYLSVGVLTNVEQYFKGLREQLESLADQPASVQNAFVHGVLREGPRPSATAAYLHALRSHRPSHRVRSFVEDPGPIELRGANSHDPALLWAGLGRR